MSTRWRSQKDQNKSNPKGLHPRNLHKDGYDFPALIKSYSSLAPHINPNGYGSLSIDFANPAAVKALNSALLKHHYNVLNWDIPDGALCPPIPGRVDYIHAVADLLGWDEKKTDRLNIKLLDIGTGANGIYPLLACKIYGWHCVGSDINEQSLENVASIISNNPDLKESFILRHQPDKNKMFDGIIRPGEFFDVSVCNPPFHASRKDALKSSQRKLNNLARNRGEQISNSPTPNFGGLEDELWCKGGERLFLRKYIKESQSFANQCRWFTSLVSKSENLKPSRKLIRKMGALDVREIEMAQGNKKTRILAWSFTP